MSFCNCSMRIAFSNSAANSYFSCLSTSISDYIYALGSFEAPAELYLSKKGSWAQIGLSPAPMARSVIVCEYSFESASSSPLTASYWLSSLFW